MTILRINNGTVRTYQNNPNTDIRLNENGISLEHDIRYNRWCVNVRRVVTFSFETENSARQVYNLISRDVLNYLSFRWGRPQQ